MNFQAEILKEMLSSFFRPAPRPTRAALKPEAIKRWQDNIFTHHAYSQLIGDYLSGRDWQRLFLQTSKILRNSSQTKKYLEWFKARLIWGPSSLYLQSPGCVLRLVETAYGKVEAHKLDLLDGSCVRQIAPTKKADFIITKAGEVWWMHHEQAHSSFERIEIKGMPSIKQAFCTWDSIFLVAHNGEVWVWGDNTTGALGLGPEIKFCSHPMRVTGLPAIDHVFSNEFYTFFVAKNGRVYACGSNNSGQLGLGDTETHFFPQQVKGIPAIKRVSSSYCNTVFEAWDGTVRGCGTNASGRLGLGDQKEHHSAEPVPQLSNIARVFLDQPTFWQAVDGAVWATGDNDYRELGLKKAGRSVNTPQRVRGTPPIADIVHPFFITLFIDINNDVWACGKNGEQWLGLPVGHVTPQRIPHSPVIAQALIYNSAHARSEYIRNRNEEILKSQFFQEQMIYSFIKFSNCFFLTKEGSKIVLRVQGNFPRPDGKDSFYHLAQPLHVFDASDLTPAPVPKDGSSKVKLCL